MSEVITTNNEDFKQIISSSEELVLIDFYADWCGPCRQLSPVLDEIATKYDGKVKVLKINVDSNSELAQEYQVRSIPQMFFLKKGEQLDAMKGFQNTSDLSSKLDTLLA